MESETFEMRKQFLEEFYNEDRIKFLRACRVIEVGDFTAHNRRFNNNFYIDTVVYFEKKLLKNYYKFLKPFIYFLYSFTYREKFLQDSILFIQNKQIKYFYNNPFENGRFNASLSFHILPSENINFIF